MSSVSESTPGDRTLRGIRHVGSARVITQAITWGLTAVTVHILAPRDYGLIATAGLITTFAQMLLDGGLREVLVSRRELSAPAQGAAVTAVLMISLILGALVFAVAPWASAFFHAPPLRAIIEVSALYLPLNGLEVIPGALLLKSMRYARVAVITTVSSIVQGVATLGLAYLGDAYWALIFGSFIGTGLRTACYWASLDRKPMPSRHLKVLWPLVRSSSHLIGQRLTYFSIDNFDLFLLSRVGSPIVLGPYSVARNLAHSALDQIARVMNQVLLPAFAAKTETVEQARALVLVLSLGATLLFPLFWTLGVVSQIAFPLVFGHRWSGLVVLFVAFSAILPLRCLYSIADASVIGTGRTGTTFLNMLTWAVIILPLIGLGVTQGAVGVALSWTVGFPFVFYFGMRRIATALSMRVSTLLRPLLVPAACAAAGALAAQALLWGLTGVLARPIVLALQCCTAGLVYWALLRMFGRLQYSQTLATVHRLIRS